PPRPPEPEPAEEATVMLKAPPLAGRRPAAAPAPLPEDDDTSTVVVRGPVRGGTGSARPKQASAPEPQSEEPATILMRGPASQPAPVAAPAHRGSAPAEPPPASMPPPPPYDPHAGTTTSPLPPKVEGRRSVLTLVLGGIGLMLLFLVMTAAAVLVIRARRQTPAPSPVAEAPSPAASVVPPSPVPVVKGAVHIETVPPGATVTLDGSAVGKTPMDVHDLSLASHEVKLELDGYAPMTEPVMLTAESPQTEVKLTLSRTAPATGAADVSSNPPGATVKIDGTSVGVTPLRGHKLNVGRHRVELAAEGYEPYSASLTVREGQTARMEAPLVAHVVAKPSPKLSPTPVPAPTPDTHVYDENDPLISPKPIKVGGKSGEYPREAPALKRGQRASVTVSFVVLETGEVTDVQVVESAGSTVDDAVVSAFKTWKFTPGSKQGAKVRVRVTRRQTFLGG
ncbi:MAG TPA: TonB family protein, partial [Vicinamibacteria bacterium]|nr:TonB family protein [Vicinamibacteria bacterium]